MVFGGSVGPEAGLVGAIAAICTWVGDRLKRFGSQFKELTEAGMYAAISAIFTAPLYGFAKGLGGSKVSGSEDISISKQFKAIIYIFAIAGALLTFLLLSEHIGGGLSLPRYTDIVYGTDEFIWLIPIAIVGSIAGLLFCVCDVSFRSLGEKFSDKPVVKATIGGLALGLCGIVLPLTMFAGEVQAEELNETWMTMSMLALFGTGFVKIILTAFGVNMGWRGGHFFPVIFSGISIGYGLSMAIGIDPVFCVCATTAAVVGGVMRRPVMAIFLLFLCFPFHSIIILAIAAAIGAYMPLPKTMKEKLHG
jgi:H+/Cl- antiporter ClcA